MSVRLLSDIEIVNLFGSESVIYMFEGKNLAVYYGKEKVFDNLSFVLPSTGIVALRGKSGAGKTTLLQVLAGLKDYEGTLLSKMSANDRLAYVFQGDRLLPWFSALENVMLAVYVDNKNIDTDKVKFKITNKETSADKYNKSDEKNNRDKSKKTDEIENNSSDDKSARGDGRHLTSVIKNENNSSDRSNIRYENSTGDKNDSNSKKDDSGKNSKSDDSDNEKNLESFIADTANIKKINSINSINNINKSACIFEKRSVKKLKKKIAEEMLIKVGLGNDIHKFPDELSGGMRQRVNIARALAYRPGVFLLDEPFKGLDKELKLQIKEIFEELSKKTLIILVSHEDVGFDYDDEILLP